MKAEHRKELETNVLADRMGRMVDTFKHGPQNPKTWWYALAAAVVIGGGIWAIVYFTGQNREKSSALWTKLENIGQNTDFNQTIKELDELATSNAGTIPARTANFEEARLLLSRGMENLGSLDQHPSALDELERARTLYEQQEPKVKDTPLLQQEAMMGAAKAEESLIGSGRGTIERAQELYQKLADAYPDTFQGEAAKKRIAELKSKRQQVLDFYTKLNQRASKKN
ncbi:MAG: hypothetical protein K2R98_04235 [Gemmataceae bacterium]|nr:hypothetical protein [Gemmataceae bacterium]